MIKLIGTGVWILAITLASVYFSLTMASAPKVDTAAAEREACAKVCESMRPSEQEFDQRFYTACTLNANAIRARGQA